jgi:enolase
MIKSIKAREILDSRGNPTIEVDLVLDDDSKHRAAVPSGASTGIYEALELRDGDKTRFGGKGVLKACENVNTIIAPQLCGMDATQQEKIDKLMVESLDGTKNEWGWCKKNLGANAILAVSLAVCRAGAYVSKVPLYKYIAKLSGNDTEKFIMPVPSFNVINGGSHAGNQLALQEFMILPTGAESFHEAMRIGAEIYQTLKKVILEKYGLNATNVGDEGGFAPDFSNTEEAFLLLQVALEKSGHKDKVVLGMDCAASEFYDEETKNYNLLFKSQTEKQLVSGDELAELYAKWAEKYNVQSIEDPFEQSDFDAYSKFTAKNGENFQIVGDDLLVTNPVRVQIGIEKKLCNALLLKVNQIGTITESIEAYQLSKKNGWGVMVSHRSGETEDNFIADLVVGLGTGQIKTGAPCRSERLAKYNQLLRIEEELGSNSTYAGKKFKYPY